MVGLLRGLLPVVALVAVCLPTLYARDVPFVKRLNPQRSLQSQLHGHEGTDRAGADLYDAPVVLTRGASAKRCAQLCLATSGCKAWSFDPSGGFSTCTSTHADASVQPHCYLKHSLSSVAAHSCRTSGTPYATLINPAFPKLPASAVTPKGWWATQLQLQASGLAGHLQLFWSDVSDSEFIGGHHDTPDHNVRYLTSPALRYLSPRCSHPLCAFLEQHERLPYWLNGMISLAYLNNDTVLIRAVSNFTSYILDHQRVDGWLGPVENFDPWPRMLLLYIFQQYSELNATDTRVIPAMYKSVHCEGCSLSFPAAARGRRLALMFAATSWRCVSDICTSCGRSTPTPNITQWTTCGHT